MTNALASATERNIEASQERKSRVRSAQAQSAGEHTSLRIALGGTER
jgi:hypothetical protein